MSGERRQLPLQAVTPAQSFRSKAASVSPRATRLDWLLCPALFIVLISAAGFFFRTLWWLVLHITYFRPLIQTEQTMKSSNSSISHDRTISAAFLSYGLIFGERGKLGARSFSRFTEGALRNTNNDVILYNVFLC